MAVSEKAQTENNVHVVRIGETVHAPGDRITPGRFRTSIFVEPPIEVTKALVEAIEGPKHDGIQVRLIGSTLLRTEFSVIEEGDQPPTIEEAPVRELEQIEDSAAEFPEVPCIVAARLDSWIAGEVSANRLLHSDAGFPGQGKIQL